MAPKGTASNDPTAEKRPAADERLERRRAFAEALGRAAGQTAGAAQKAGPAGRTAKGGGGIETTTNAPDGDSHSDSHSASSDVTSRLAVRRGSAEPLAVHRSKVREAFYRSPAYSLFLLGGKPSSLAVLPPDPWPGDAPRGTAILQGQFRFSGQTLKTSGDPWNPSGASEGWLTAVHGFGWLRDLRAVGGDGARRRARELVGGWIASHNRWSHPAWRTDILAARIAAWLGQ